MKPLLPLLFLCFISFGAYSQTSEEKEIITKGYDSVRLDEIAKMFKSTAEFEKQKALELAQQNGWIIRQDVEGVLYELMGVTAEGNPLYYTTNNVDAAKSTRAYTLHNGSLLGLNIEGQNMTSHVWDGGLARSTHQEYDGIGGSDRFSIGDGTTALHYHSAHVTGTIIASGVVAQAKGMAPQAYAVGYDWNTDASEATTAAGNGMLLSNHSYGWGASGIPDWYFGAYNYRSREWDVIMYNAPYYLMVCSAGNDGNDNSSNGDPLDGNSSYDKLSGFKTTKNNMVVANGQDANIDASGNLISVTINSGSSEGPTDDYRIKPDITGNGTAVYSTYEGSDTEYNSISGTSMASPNVNGTLLLLQQHYNNVNSSFMRAATLKGLALHTADDAGPAGPDVVYGWGLLNAKEAANAITNNGVESTISELSLNQGNSYSVNVESDGMNNLVASISWTDPAGPENTGIANDNTPVLVNDLDIRVTKGGSTYYPYRLTSITTNGTGDNTVDPYEKVIVSGASGSYTISVTHKGSLSGGSQNFTLIVTGKTVSSAPPVADFNADDTTPAVGQTVNFTDNSSGSPTSWSWSFNPTSVSYVGGSNSNSQNPQVRFNASGYYTVTLVATNTYGSDPETKTNYILAGTSGNWTGVVSIDWNTAGNWENLTVPTSTDNIAIPATAVNWPTFTGDFALGNECNDMTLEGSSQFTSTGDISIPAGMTLTCNGLNDIFVGGDWNQGGAFNPGTGAVNFTGNNNVIIDAGGSASNSLQTTFTSNNGSYGNMFDIVALNEVMVTSFEANLDAATNNVHIYYKTGTYVGSETNSSVWIYIGTASVTSIGAGAPTTIPIPVDITIPAGETYAFYIHAEGGNDYTNGSTAGSVYVSDANIQILEGCGKGSPLFTGGTYSPRVFNGIVHYSYSSGTGAAIYNHLTISKTNAEVTTNADVNVQGNLRVNSRSQFTNAAGNTFAVTGNALFVSDANGMASYLDNGTTTISGNTNYQEYLTSQRWHLVSPPVSGASIDVYFDIYLKEYNEPTDTWTYLVTPTTMPMNVGQGYAAWASDDYTGPTTVTYTGALTNNNTLLNSLDYTSVATKAGFNLIGNPYPCALDWNTNWSMSNMSGWMVVYDNGTYRGIHTDGTPYNGKTDGIIPPTQGFWVRALNSSGSITIPATERLHSGQAFYKEASEFNYPVVRLETEINGYTDETVVIFHPEATEGFDGYYDLSKFENVEEAPQLYTMTEGGNYAVNFYGEDYQEKVIPVGFKTLSDGFYTIQAATISNFSEETGIYLEDLKTGIITKLSDNPQYDFSYDSSDEEHRFNLHFTNTSLDINDVKISGMDIYAYQSTVYIKNPALLDGNIVIYDVMGQEVINQKTSNEAIIQIDVNHGMGYYFVKVNSGEKTVTKKVFLK